MSYELLAIANIISKYLQKIPEKYLTTVDNNYSNINYKNVKLKIFIKKKKNEKLMFVDIINNYLMIIICR